ncbi:MAG: hypothetical protein FWC21_01175 [Treponema sp.]|nr:hypothetical protein [Treponema sp.]
MKKIKTKLNKAIALVIPLAAMLACYLFFSACKEICPSGYALNLPRPPEAWVSLLGDPHWRVEWLDASGQKQIADIEPFQSMEIEMPVTWANPVTAWPYWPEQNLIPGFYKPAGALFPFDVKDGILRLSWEAGHDAIFYWELIFANNQNHSRLPANFDWLRFRELFRTGSLRESVKKDPWLVNWQSAAKSTASGNFDTRRLIPETAELKIIAFDSLIQARPRDIHSVLWYGASPFSDPLFFAESEPAVFPVRPGINVWISEAGILRVNGNVWVFTELKN